ncbi:hypothetical protein [Soonwooa sp.]|uniref:hypothetical protein n=1 Tax=Soonwooa sp. TaxID=1938592 RepID=UPI0028A9C8A8|nr:hypothetical protein [Soonwooa sp.]
MIKNGIKYKPDNFAELTQSKEFFINLNALTEPNPKSCKTSKLGSYTSRCSQFVAFFQKL